MMTVNQVNDILLAFNRTGRWEEALDEHLPRRKMIHYHGTGQKDGDEGQDEGQDESQDKAEDETVEQDQSPVVLSTTQL